MLNRRLIVTDWDEERGKKGGMKVSQQMHVCMCMHVCASNPQFLTPDDVPEEVVEKERAVQLEIATNEGKPKDIAEKMVAGRMKKYTGEVSLTGQPFVMEPKKSVEQVLNEKGTSVSNFIRLEVGEGIEKIEQPSFAEEVAAMAARK